MSLNLMMNVNAKVMKGLEEMFQANTISTIKIMANKYGFSEEEALAFVNVSAEVKMVKGKVKEVKEGKEKVVKEKKEKKEKKEVPKMVLPFCGRVVSEWCEGVKMNHGLYSQCTSEKGASETGGEKYCKSCKKQAETNETGKPTLGDINERMSVSSAVYRAEKGKKCVVYAAVMKKLKIEKAEAVAEALKFGLEIPEEEFEMPKSQRGRPKKLSESESVKSGSDNGEKKTRGRPKKNKTVADNQTDETDDLIASLVAEANALKNTSDAEASDSEASEAEEEADASEADASEADASEAGDEEESVDVNEPVEWEPSLLEKIVAKLNADETFNKMNATIVPKKDRKKHLNAIGEYIKSILTEEEMALYTGAPEVEEEEEAEEDEATRKAREAAEKKALAEEEKKAKKEQADLEKKQKKEQADLEKKAKAEADKKVKAEADAEKKALAEAEKKAKKEQADLEKKQKKEQADLEKKAKADAEGEKKPAEKKEKKPAEKKEKKAVEKKVAEVKPVEKETPAELQAEVVEEASVAVAEETEAVNAKVFEFQGKKYLKTEEGILYDQETEECVGVWNEETKSIDDFADDEE